MNEDRKRWLLSLALLTFTIGCDADDKGGDDDGGETPVVRAGDEGGVPAGVEARPPVSGVEVGGVAGGEGGEGGAGGSSGGRSIESCEDLCGLYESCGTAPSPWGDACLEGCMEQDWESRNFRSYVVCLLDEPCDNISSCRIPPPPLPSCEEACALTDACEADFRLPTALTQMGTCGGACQDPTWARQIPSCVQDNSLNLCGSEEGFARCILEDRGADCLALCDALAGCDEGVDAVDCALECMGEAPEADPLAELHRQEQRACVTSAGSCEAVSACLNPAAPAIGESVERACAAGEACGVLVDGACPEAMAVVAGDLSAEGLSCLADELEAGCDRPLISCLSQSFSPSEQACGDYCRAAAICDALPEGQVEFDCIEGCNRAMGGQDPTALAGYQGRFTCAEANSCADFTSCVALSGGAVSCEEHCAAREACGDLDGAACLTRCESSPNTERVRVERACGALLSCDAQTTLCDLPSAPDCASLCEPLEACGLGGDSCALRCDNEHFADPEPFLPLLSCVNSTERCDERADCSQDPARGAACLAYCEHQVSCEGVEVSLEGCVVSCARGQLEGEDLNRFATARECLSTQAGASCEAQEACFDSAELSTLCEGVCATASSCGFEVGAEGCLEACEADAGAFNGLACVSLSDSRAGGCAGAAACLGVEAPVPTPACDQLCARQKECDPATDLFLCHAQCIASDEGDIARAACAELSSCETLDICLGEVMVSESCVTLCEGQAVSCSAEFGASARFEDIIACEERCAGIVLALGAEQEAPFSECVSEAMCDGDTLDRCWAGELTSPSEELCARSWAAVNLCLPSLFDEAMFLMECALEYEADPTATLEKVECLEQSIATDPTCLSALSCPGLF